MEERTIEIGPEENKRKVLAGNAALFRFRKAGGKLSSLENVDTEDTDSMLESMETILLLVHANLVLEPEENRMEPEDLANLFATIEEVSAFLEDFFAGVPWLKNRQATGSADA